MSEVEEWGDNREGEEKLRTKGGVVSLARFTRVCPARGREEEGGRCELSFKVREYVNTHTETATMVMLASYESNHRCAGVVTCSCLITVEVGIHLGGREFKF